MFYWTDLLGWSNGTLGEYVLVFSLSCHESIAWANFAQGVTRGYGKHREALGPNVDYDFFRGFFVAEIVYTFIITFVKYSILALYYRLFGSDNIRWPVSIMAFVATAWGIAVVCLESSLGLCRYS